MTKLPENYVWNLIMMKFPHAEWCELKTGLWHECDCGDDEKRMKLYERFLKKFPKTPES